MPYGEMKFEDEEYYVEEGCEVCGCTEGHEQDCPLRREEFPENQHEFNE